MFARYLAKPPRVAGLDSLASRLLADVERFARPRHIHAQARANAQVRDQLRERLRELGYVVHEQGEHRNLLALPTELVHGDQPPKLPDRGEVLERRPV